LLKVTGGLKSMPINSDVVVACDVRRRL